MSQRNGNVSLFRAIFFTVLFGYGAYAIEPTNTHAMAARIFCAIVAGVSLWTIINAIPAPIYNWLKRRQAKKATDNHGSARWANRQEIARYGLYKTNGLYLGVSAYDGQPIFQHGEGHWMIYAPTRSGKTRNLVVPNILHYRGSMLIPDIKGELWDVTSDACKTKHKNTIYRLDPAGLKNAIAGLAHRYNPLSRIYEPWVNGRHSDVIAKAKAMALQLLPEPSPSDKNEYFRNGSRKIIVFVIVYLVITLEEKATLAKVLALIQDNFAMQDALQIAMCSNALSGDLARMAKDLLQKLEAKNNEHWHSFCEGAVQVLDIYSESGDLAESTSTCDFYFRDLKEMDCKIYEIVDPTRMAVFAPWLALIHWCALDELISSNSRKEVILMLDEAANFMVSGLIQKLTLLAGYGCRAILVLQSFSAFEKTYSKQDLEILLDQCECKIWLKVQSYRVAELVSKSLGHKTIVSSTHPLGHDYRDLAQDTMGEMARRLMTPDEVMKTSRAIIELRSQRPILAETVGYDAVKPWNKWAGVNTLYGNKKLISKTRIKFHYPSNAWWNTCFGLIKHKPVVTYFRRIRHKRNWSGLPFVLIHTFRAMLWMAPIAALGWAVMTYGSPYVLYEYEYYGSRKSPIMQRCTYWGIEGRRVHPGPACPFIQFMD